MGPAAGLALEGLEASLYEAGPPAGHTGGFGEPTCLACHFDGELNEEGGSLELAGLPEVVEAGELYDLEVRLTHPELRRAGFQLSVRFSEGEREGRTAGDLVAGVGQAQVRAGEPEVAYLQHTAGGSEVDEPGSAVWSFQWRAPPSFEGMPVFHIAANAANDDLSEFGDYIYALAVTTSTRSDTTR